MGLVNECELACLKPTVHWTYPAHPKLALRQTGSAYSDVAVRWPSPLSLKPATHWADTECLGLGPCPPNPVVLTLALLLPGPTCLYSAVLQNDLVHRTMLSGLWGAPWVWKVNGN